MVTKKRSKPQFKFLFQTLSADKFLSIIFSSYTYRRYASQWNMSYDTVAIKLERIKAYYQPSDIYEYFKINDSFNSHLEEEVYESSVFKLLTNIGSDVPQDILVEYKDEPIAHPNHIFLYELIQDINPSRVSFARDYLMYGLDIAELKVKYGSEYPYLIKRLKEIYQLELLPIDISLQSFI